MRLTCPECGADYEAPDSEIPTEGRHVQCTACHTRWFARRPPAEDVSEDEIIARLESRRPNLRAVPDPGESGNEADEGDFQWEGEPETGTGEAAPAPSEPVRSGLAPFPAPGASAVPQPRSVPEQQPEPSSPPAAPAAVSGSTRETAPNETHRLDLTGEATQATGTRKPDQGGFRRGMLIGFALMVAALVLYLLARPVAGSVPLAGGYVGLIDGIRAALALATQT